MEKAVIYREKEEFKDLHLVLKNASSNQFYEFSFELDNFPNIRIRNIANLQYTGLTFENNKISGTPYANNVHDLDIEFYHIHDEGSTEIKKVHLFINADPKDLWKNIPSDTDDIYHKPDENSYEGNFLDKKITAVSKRGRSHAHEGKFRDDDFAVKDLPGGWFIISVADGAGSAVMAREGSRLAVSSVNRFFDSEDILNDIEKNIEDIYSFQSSKEIRSEAGENVIRCLYEGVYHVYHVLDKTAAENSFSIKDFHTTLVFTLTKKFDFGYVILSFGVGDCPVSLINPDFSEVRLLNRMDVGEYGGGTRFVTMKEIFNDDNVASRFTITCVNDFSYLVLMTDGIYDPKFITESRLEDIESWKAFFNDLSGNNADRAKIDFINDTDIDQQLLLWTDFWSRGNHDDRTLAIIY